MDKEIPRNSDMLIASESIFQQFREMVAAGFTEEQALYYLATLFATLTHLNSNKHKRGDKIGKV